MKNRLVFSDSGQTLELPNGLKLHLSSRRLREAARFLGGEIFLKNRYLRKGFELEETDTIVDIGANMGLFVMWAVTRAPKGKIFAIEPTASIDILNMNLERNDIKNVKTVKAAVGLPGEYLDIVTYPGFNAINHQSDMRPTFRTRMLVKILTSQRQCRKVIERVPAISLGEIIDENNLEKVDFLKIDAEGCEYKIFRNLSDEHFNKIEKIAMEFHEYHPDNDYRELVSILKNRGYYLEVERPFFDYRLVGKCGFIWARRHKR